MYYMYIIHSVSDGRYYVGSSSDPWSRLERYNASWTRSTKGNRPWELVYIGQYEEESRALSREREMKKMKSRKYIERMIRGGSCPDTDIRRHRPDLFGASAPL